MGIKLIDTFRHLDQCLAYIVSTQLVLPIAFFFFNLFFKTFIFRERGREEERERNINVWLPLPCPLLGTWPATQARVLTGNWTSDSGSQAGVIYCLSLPLWIFLPVTELIHCCGHRKDRKKIRNSFFPLKPTTFRNWKNCLCCMNIYFSVCVLVIEGYGWHGIEFHLSVGIVNKVGPRFIYSFLSKVLVSICSSTDVRIGWIWLLFRETLIMAQWFI